MLDHLSEPRFRMILLGVLIVLVEHIVLGESSTESSGFEEQVIAPRSAKSGGGEVEMPPTVPEEVTEAFYFRKITPASLYVGLLFAGKAEFIWIVDIRMNSQSHELWSIGNVINYHYVLTTCRAILMIQHLQAAEQTGSDVRGKSAESELRVTYCSQYLWEDFRLVNNYRLLGTYDSYYASGTRTVRNMLPHPKCKINSFMHDVGVLHLTTGIAPYSPFFGYMPLNITPSSGDIQSIDFNRKEEKLHPRICYVASFGKPYTNLRNHSTIDYKVRFRVYHEEWNNCMENPERKDGCPKKYKACNSPYTNTQKKKLTCFITKGKVGTVCDHDRGAPLVCDNVVKGIVVRGADFDKCHNLIPQIFIVLHIDIFNDYLTSVSAFNFDAILGVPASRSCTMPDQPILMVFIMFSFKRLLVLA